MTKLSVCQQLFGEPIQTSAVANKEKEVRKFERVWRVRYFGGLVQDCSNSSALAMELLQSCTKPSTCSCYIPLQRGWNRGILVSPCPSVRLSICGRNRVRLYLQQYLLDPFNIIHLIKQLQKVCYVYILLQNSRIWIFGKLLKEINFDCVFFYLGSDMNE